MENIRKESWKLFDQISPTYDRINRILSLGLDRSWRKKLAHYLPSHSKIRLIDLAAGTGDQLFAILEMSSSIHKAIGFDLSEKMLEIAKKKIANTSFSDRVEFLIGDALDIPLKNETAEVITMAFGIRNVSSPLQCMREMYRILCTGGKALILEFSLPKNPWIKYLSLFYLRYILPKIGALFSKNSLAYSYLNQTIETFPYGEAFCTWMREAGFKTVKKKAFTFGIVTLYIAEK